VGGAARLCNDIPGSALTAENRPRKLWAGMEQTNGSLVSPHRYAEKKRVCRVAGVYRRVHHVPGWTTGCGETKLASGGDSTTKKPAPRAAKVQGKDRDMGSALRTVYQKTVEEDVPADLLDLLGKLD
jgi:hypothetical protein